MKPFTLEEHEQWMLERHGDSRNQLDLSEEIFNYPSGNWRIGPPKYNELVLESIGYYKEEE